MPPRKPLEVTDMDLELEIEPIASIAEVVFLEDWMEDEEDYMFEITRRCLVWDPARLHVLLESILPKE